MKKNIIKYFILPCFSIALVFLLFPFRVLADSTYSSFEIVQQCFVLTYDRVTSQHDGISIRFFDNMPHELRAVTTLNGSYYVTAFVSPVSFQYSYNYGASSCSASYYQSYQYSLNGSSYYMVFGNGTSSYGGAQLDGVPKMELASGLNFTQSCIYYTFGDGAIAPCPSYGNVKDVSFATNIAGNGDASGQNLDKIEWNRLQDSNGNDLPEGSTVTIRAVPGQYTGTSKENLLTKLYTDFVIDTAHATDLATVSAFAGWYETTWQSVVSHFAWPFATVLSCLQGESYWYKNGWIYQIRLNIDDYHSEWQTIYNITSSGVENSETIINSTSITAISQSVNNINNINQTTNNNYVSNNSDTTNNYYYYDSQINPDYSGNDVSGLFPSISEILNAIRNLPHTIGELLHNLFDDLFEIDWEYDDFEQQKQYVIENSGAFGQCIGHLDDLKTSIMSYNTASGVALIQWGDIVIDETVIIPAGVFNLGSIVAEDPMRSFYTLYQSLFSGYLYTLTFIKLYREALKALRQ